MPSAWDAPKAQIEQRLRDDPNIDVSQLQETARIFCSQLLRSEKWFQEEGLWMCARYCMNGRIQETHFPASYSIMSNESLARVWSRLVSDWLQNTLQDMVNSCLIDADDAGNLAAKLDAALKFTLGTPKIAKESIEEFIKKAKKIARPPNEPHADPCYRNHVPFGIEITVSLEGIVIVERSFTIDRATNTITWKDEYKITNNLEVEVRVEQVNGAATTVAISGCEEVCAGVLEEMRRHEEGSEERGH